MGLQFEWGKRKAQLNKKKHKIDFKEAATVFKDKLSLTIIDTIYTSIDEERYVTLGLSSRQKLLVVVHCDREDKIRIISARKATKREIRSYEEK